MEKITFVGTGYVGLVSGACLAEVGNSVICVDRDKSKIAQLQEGITPIYEPSLETIIKNNLENGRLSFSMDLGKAVKESDIVFLAVGTPSDENGKADLSYVEEAARAIGKNIEKYQYKIIVMKSTVPVGTTRRIEKIIRENCPQGANFDVVSNPEFLREGSAVADTFNMDRAIIGADNELAAARIERLFRAFTISFVKTTPETSEMIKYSSNAFLATKISFINEISNLCEKVNADVKVVAKGMGLDKRIGIHFLDAGVGYGGSCFPKDIRALIHTSQEAGYDLKLIRTTEEINLNQRKLVIDKITDYLHDLEGKTIGILGVAFKPGTDDIREAPAITVIEQLLAGGAKVKVYDPIAVKKIIHLFGERIKYCFSIEETAVEADALVLLTEWEEFKNIDFIKVSRIVGQKFLIDGRNLYEKKEVEDMGWKYCSFGR